MECDREGTFRGTIVEAGIVEGKSPSKSIGINFTALFDEHWNPDLNDGQGGWEPWDYDMSGTGTVWIRGKNGDLSQQNIEAFVNYAGWSGDLVDIVEARWRPTRCQFVVQASTYKDETRFRVEFINDLNRTPGALQQHIDTARGKALQSELGASLRAIASSVKKPQPTGKPTSPPPGGSAPAAKAGPPAPAGKRPPPQNSRVSNPSGGEDDIPFDEAAQQ